MTKAQREYFDAFTRMYGTVMVQDVDENEVFMVFDESGGYGRPEPVGARVDRAGKIVSKAWIKHNSEAARAFAAFKQSKGE